MSDAAHGPSNIQSAGATHRGRVRSENEDAYLLRPEAGLWVVSDGMGGHEGGAFASKAIVAALAEVAPTASAAELLSACERQLEAANRQIQDYSSARNGATVGATVVALLIFDGHYACLWCGDSRLYRIRNGEIRQLSRDHTELQALLDEGVLTEEEARSWPNRNILTKAIGVSAAPDTDMNEGRLAPGDVFVLCSDGLTLHVDDEEIARIATRRPARSGCEDLLDLALDRGGRDNVTAVIVHFNPETTLRRTARASGREEAPGS